MSVACVIIVVPGFVELIPIALFSFDPMLMVEVTAFSLDMVGVCSDFNFECDWIGVLLSILLICGDGW